MFSICIPCFQKINYMTLFSESDVKHTPVSSIKPEEIERCKISGLCCSPDGVVYASDQGSRKIYRIETNTGNCYSFGMNHLGKVKIG